MEMYANLVSGNRVSLRSFSLSKSDFVSVYPMYMFAHLCVLSQQPEGSLDNGDPSSCSIDNINVAS